MPKPAILQTITRKTILSLGLLLCFLVSSIQQVNGASAAANGLRSSWVADDPAAVELLSMADDEATTQRRITACRLRQEAVKSKLALRKELVFAALCAEKSFAATLAAYAQQYAHQILPPGYYLFLFRCNLF